MEIADIAQFGFAGFLALLAWRFWEKSPRLALTFLVAAGAGGILLMILEVRNASNPYDVKLLPPPSPSWAAVHDGGTQIPVVSALLIRGDTVEREVTMESVPSQTVSSPRVSIQQTRAASSCRAVLISRDTSSSTICRAICGTQFLQG